VLAQFEGESDVGSAFEFTGDVPHRLTDRKLVPLFAQGSGEDAIEDVGAFECFGFGSEISGEDSDECGGSDQSEGRAQKRATGRHLRDYQRRGGLLPREGEAPCRAAFAKPARREPRPPKTTPARRLRQRPEPALRSR